MEQRFKSLSLLDFQRRLSSEADCFSYLADLKWENGYGCRWCGNGNSCKGVPGGSRQCTSCNYTESPTANTLFHRVKFNLVNVFYIVYFVGTNKKGITSTELSRKLGLRQKTCWAIKHKVIKAIKSSGNHPITGSAEVEETVFGSQDECIRGRKNNNKKLVVVGTEKKKNGVSRLYAREISRGDAASLCSFMKEGIFENLMAKIVSAPPCYIRNISN